MRHSVEQACLVPKHVEWDRGATVHAEIFGLLADAAVHQAVARMPGSGAGFAHRLMVTAGPAAGMMTANSRQRQHAAETVRWRIHQELEMLCSVDYCLLASAASS